MDNILGDYKESLADVGVDELCLSNGVLCNGDFSKDIADCCAVNNYGLNSVIIVLSFFNGEGVAFNQINDICAFAVVKGKGCLAVCEENALLCGESAVGSLLNKSIFAVIARVGQVLNGEGKLGVGVGFNGFNSLCDLNALCGIKGQQAVIAQERGCIEHAVESADNRFLNERICTGGVSCLINKEVAAVCKNNALGNIPASVGILLGLCQSVSVNLNECGFNAVLGGGVGEYVVCSVICSTGRSRRACIYAVGVLCGVDESVFGIVVTFVLFRGSVECNGIDMFLGVVILVDVLVMIPAVGIEAVDAFAVDVLISGCHNVLDGQLVDFRLKTYFIDKAKRICHCLDNFNIFCIFIRCSLKAYLVGNKRNQCRRDSEDHLGCAG